MSSLQSKLAWKIQLRSHAAWQIVYQSWNLQVWAFNYNDWSCCCRPFLINFDQFYGISYLTMCIGQLLQKIANPNQHKNSYLGFFLIEKHIIRFKFNPWNRNQSTDLHRRSWAGCYVKGEIVFKVLLSLIDMNFLRVFSTLSAKPQNGQTHLNNSSTFADEFIEFVWPFCGVGA